MKVTIPTTKEVNVKFITIEVAVRYNQEDIPNDAPMRKGDMWKASVDIEAGRVIDWPTYEPLTLHMKVCDEGLYKLFDQDWVELACIDGYVPHGIVPGKYGDYIEMDIDEDGFVTNWPKKPSFSDFFDIAD